MKRAKKTIGNLEEAVVPDYTNVMPLEFTKGTATLYHESFAVRMFGLAQIGLTTEQLALAFGVGPSTINLWLTKHDEFKIAYDNGKDIHDHSVQKTMLQRALGYTYEEVKHFSGVDSLGREWTRTVKTMKVVLPDVTAGIFWLKNRHREEWADVHRSEVSGNIGVNISKTMQLDSLSAEEREMVESIAMKQIADMNGTVTE